MEIIGISGKAGVGKDFVGREVLRPAGFHQWAFAWAFKNEGVGHGFTFDEVHHTKPPHVREWLQRRGTEEGWKRHGRQYWCDIAGAWLRTLEEHHGVTKFYITDVRFPHEAEWIRAQGGKLIRLEHGDRLYPLAGTEAAQHESETALDDWTDWDAVIVNGSHATAAGIEGRLYLDGILGAPLRRAAMSLNPAEEEQLELFL